MRTVWEGIRRTHGAAQRCVVPLTGDAIRAVVAALPPKAVKAARDRALVLVGFGGAFRRSELVALDVGDLTFDPAHGVVVQVRRSKTDQVGVGPTWPSPSARRGAAGEGALFRSVLSHGRVGGRLDRRDVAPPQGAGGTGRTRLGACLWALVADGAGDQCGATSRRYSRSGSRSSCPRTNHVLARRTCPTGRTCTGAKHHTKRSCFGRHSQRSWSMPRRG